MPTITIPPGLYTYAHAFVLLAGCRWSARYYTSTYTPFKKMFGYSLDLLSKISVYIRAYIFVIVEPSPCPYGILTNRYDILSNLSFLGNFILNRLKIVRKFVMEL